MTDSPIFGWNKAQVLHRATDAELLTLVKARGAVDPAIFDESPPFFWSALISNNALDAYFTRMAPSSLRNYAADANAGVSFQDSHDTFKLGYGRSFRGEYREADSAQQVVADFYTIPDLDQNGINTNSFIRGVRAGIYSDVSIGFYGGRFICSICGLDMWRDWHCPHIPGIEYEVDTEPTQGGTGAKTRVLAVADVEDARLAEVSAVYEGATPGCAILKAEQEAERGRMRPEVIRLVEHRYRIHLPGRRVQTPGTSLPAAPAAQPQETPMGDQPNDQRATGAPADVDALTTQIRSVLTEAGAAETLSPLEAVRWLAGECTRLRPLADDGQKYRDDTIADALAEGVRAFGDTFSKETYTEVLQRANLTTIKRMRDDWRVIGDKQFPGGRVTDEGEQPGQIGDAPKPTERQVVPNEAYQG